MSQCNIDHSKEEVIKKLESQQGYLPDELFQELKGFLSGNRSQEILNDIFHLLKKYDLAAESEREERKRKLQQLIG